MKSDFTRSTFDPDKQYSRVIFQQGRPLCDADWNEQMDILLYLSREIVRELIGPHGAPAKMEGKNRTFPGFQIVVKSTNLPDDLTIGVGSYYVDGLRCVNAPPTAGALTEKSEVTYLQQPFFPARVGRAPRKEDLTPPFLVYLDAWELHRTWIDDIQMTDPALGGIDTATRLKLIWQVKVLTDLKDGPGGDLNSDVFDLEWKKHLEKQESNRGRLKARIKATPDATKSCEVKVAAQYRGRENQLYRVEVHRGGVACSPTGKFDETIATFKWSRENGSVVARCQPADPHDQPNGAVLHLEGPRDRARGFAKGDWVELTDEDREMRGEPGELIQVENIEDGKLTLATAPNSKDYQKNPRVRRWDQRESIEQPLQHGVMVVRALDREERTDENDEFWFELENGLQIAFGAAPDGTQQRYRANDYWLIPARFATGDIEWPKASEKTQKQETATPQSNPQAMPPHGIEHHYAPLRMVKPGADETELRRGFAPLADRLK